MFAIACVFLDVSFFWKKKYSIRNFFLIHGIEEKRPEVTDKVVIQTIKSDLDRNIDVKDNDMTHWVGGRSENKRRSVIVKFTEYSERSKMFNRTKRLKSKNFSITESLGKLWMRKLKAARDEYGIGNV